MGSRTETLTVKIISDGSGNLRADIVGIGDGIKRLGETSAGTNAGLATMGSTLRNLAGVGGAYVAFRALREIAGAVISVGSASVAAEQSQARLSAVLKATGNSAGLTAKEINQLVDELARTTLFDDEQIRDAAAALSSFGNIQTSIFKGALRLAADQTALYGGDLVGNIRQFGKAFSEPVEGMSALGRAGVQFSAQQQSTITALVDTNQLLEAQGLMLDIVANKFGGTATAMAQAGDGMNTLTKNWNELLESIGKAANDNGLQTLLRGIGLSFGDIKEAIDNTDEHKLENLYEQMSDIVKQIDILNAKAKNPGLSLTGQNTLDELTRERAAIRDQIVAVQQSIDKENEREAAKKKNAEAAAARAQKDQNGSTSQAAQKKLDEEIEKATRALNIQANQYRNTNLEAAGLEITLGRLAGAQNEVKAAVLVAAEALDDKLQTERELANAEVQATLRAVARADAEERTAAALKNSADADRDRARGLADRGDPKRAAAKKLNDDTFAIEATFQDDADPEARLAALQQAQNDFVESSRNDAGEWSDAWTSAGNRFASGVGDAVADVFTQQQSFAEAMKGLLLSIGHQIISTLVEIGIKRLIISEAGLAAGAAEATALAGYGAAVAAAWAPAEAAVSLSTLGANAALAQAAIVNTHALSTGLALAGQAHDGLDYVPRTGTYILEEGEAVIQKDQNKALRDSLKGGGGSRGGNVTFNIRTIDARGFDQLLRARRGMLTRMMQQAYNTRGRGALGPAG